jgi:hypothetical protein
LLWQHFTSNMQLYVNGRGSSHETKVDKKNPGYWPRVDLYVINFYLTYNQASHAGETLPPHRRSQLILLYKYRRGPEIVTSRIFLWQNLGEGDLY